jgi:hypothetical protein
MKDLQQIGIIYFKKKNQRSLLREKLLLRFIFHERRDKFEVFVSSRVDLATQRSEGDEANRTPT